MSFVQSFKFLCKEGRAAKEIHDRLCAVYGDSGPSYSTDTRWSNEFHVDVSRSKMT